MKILIMSDIHYPFSYKSEIKETIKKEKPDKIVLTGDIIVRKEKYKEFFDIIPKNLRKNTYYITGDEDKVRGDYDKVALDVDGKRLVFIHGHQFNIKSDKVTARIARAFKLINRDLPLFIFSVYAKHKLGLHNEYLFLGHTHGLRKFKSINVTCCGTFSNLKGVYSDRGYVTIDNGVITTKRLKLQLYKS